MDIYWKTGLQSSCIDHQDLLGKMTRVRHTVISCLKRMNFGTFMAAHKPIINEKMERKDYNGQGIMSGESRYTVRGNDGGLHITRQAGERHTAKNCVSTRSFGCGDVMIWSYFWGGGYGLLVIVDETVTQNVYLQTLTSNFHRWFTKLHEEHDRVFISQDGAR
jgi:hypothetical protein